MSIENDINDCLISVSVSSVETEIKISIFSVLIVLEWILSLILMWYVWFKHGGKRVVMFARMASNISTSGTGINIFLHFKMNK